MVVGQVMTPTDTAVLYDLILEQLYGITKVGGILDAFLVSLFDVAALGGVL